MPWQRSIPPGRAGQRWLVRRIGTAERGRTQLDLKLRALYPEQQRLRGLVEMQRAEWDAAVREARTWLLRAGLLGGQDALRWAQPAQPLTAELVWRTAMGLSYPVEARLSGPAGDGSDDGVAQANAATAPAARATTTAVALGVQLAVAEEASRRVDAEVTVTRRRLRALDRRLLPQLRDALATVELGLEQAEQDDGVRLRAAVRTR